MSGRRSTMRPFAQTSTATQQTTSPTTAMPDPAHSGQSRDETNPLFLLQRTIGNQAVLRMRQANAETAQVGLTGTAVPRFAHDYASLRLLQRTIGNQAVLRML